MKYQGVNVDTKVEWILWRLAEADGYVERTKLKEEMLSYDEFTASKFRTAINKIRTLNLVKNDPVPEEGDINDKHRYRLRSGIVDNYLDAKEDAGYERRLSRPATHKSVRDDIEKLQSQIDELQTENNRLESQVDDLKRLYNGSRDRVSEVHERMRDIEDEYEYICRHREVEEERWDALERLLEDHSISLSDYAER